MARLEVLRDFAALQMLIFRAVGLANPTEQKNDTVVRMTLPENNSQIMASQYQLYLPTEDQLVKEINEVKLSAENKEQ